MKLALLVVVALAALSTDGALAPPDRPYKILMLLPLSTKSHRNVFLPLANALVDRGHKVTMLSNHPLKSDKIEHYENGLPYFREENINMFELNSDPKTMFAQMSNLTRIVASEIYDVPAVKKLFERRHEFDLVVMNSILNEAMYPFVFEKKFITIATGGLDVKLSATIGNFLNPAYASNKIFDYPHPYSLLDRIKNIFFHIVIPYTWNKSVTSPAQDEISKRFPDLPPLLEIEANQSLSLINTHFSFEKPVPILPSQVEVGCMHCGPGKPLPKELEDFVKGDTPVVYMSLGSVARSTTIPAELKDVLMKTFKALPYKVLWKYEDETLGDLPSNIMIKNWMPQNDILAHKNVKVFISHCGLLGTHEAMYHKTPVIGLPIGADQRKNAARIENSQLGLYFDWNDLTVESFDAAIKEVIRNSVYREKMTKVSEAFQDQMEDPVEKAVFWTEYVIRHDGAPHLRSPERDLTWVQLLHLDILAALHIVIFVIYKTLKKLVTLFFRSSKQNRKVKKN